MVLNPFSIKFFSSFIRVSGRVYPSIINSVKTTDIDFHFCSRCWTQDGRFNKILMVPVVITVFLNVIFLVNIVRVLLIKLRKGPANGGTGSGASRTSLQALRYNFVKNLFSLFSLAYSQLILT